MTEIIILSSETIPQLMKLTGCSFEELEIKRLNAAANDEVVHYYIQIWHRRVPHAQSG